MDADVFFTTVVRTAPLEISGGVVRLDWGKKEVGARNPLYATDPEIDDPNPRGSTRGGRGIELLGSEILATTYHSIYRMDPDLSSFEQYSHPLMVGIHETSLTPRGTVLLSSTSIDAVLEYDVERGDVLQQWWPREHSEFQEEFGLKPLVIDKKADNRHRFLDQRYKKSESHLHLNAVSVYRGDVYALFHAKGALCNLDKGEVVVEDEALVQGHNVLIGDDGLAVMVDTRDRTIRYYDLEGGGKLTRVIDLLDFDWVRDLRGFRDIRYYARKLLEKSGFGGPVAQRPLWVRVLARHEGHLFVGLSPASILCIEESSGELADAFRYSTDEKVCVHGLEVKGN